MGVAMDELERFKTDINLTAYAASRGYQLDRRESSRNSVVMRHPGSDDKIVVSRAEGDRHWIYFSVRDGGDNGTILDFVQRRDRCSLGEVRRELLPWIGAEPPRVSPDLYRAAVSPRAVDREATRAEYDGARRVFNSAYLNSRGIRPITIGDPRFVETLRADPRGNILFPHRDSLGFAGFESKGYHWTSFSVGGVKALWSSNVSSTDTRLVLVESAIDALSHYQLHPDAHTRYASTAGAISPHQRAVIDTALRMLPPKTTVVLGFDRDAAGDDLAKQVRELSPGPFERATSPVGKDWNDCLQARERAFIESLSRRSGLCRFP
jgi:hypothetical protein